MAEPNERSLGISFSLSATEHRDVRKIVDRADAAGLIGDCKVGSEMDLIAAHANGCPMDFARMLGANDASFAHDFCGIARHLDRSTGKLMDCFVPRFARAEGEACP